MNFIKYQDLLINLDKIVLIKPAYPGTRFVLNNNVYFDREEIDFDAVCKMLKLIEGDVEIVEI